MEYYSAIKRNKSLAICNNMGGPRGNYAKQNKSDRKRQIPYDLTYMWNLKTKQNKTTQKMNKQNKTEPN